MFLKELYFKINIVIHVCLYCVYEVETFLIFNTCLKKWVFFKPAVSNVCIFVRRYDQYYG